MMLGKRLKEIFTLSSTDQKFTQVEYDNIAMIYERRQSLCKIVHNSETYTYVIPNGCIFPSGWFRLVTGDYRIAEDCSNTTIANLLSLCKNATDYSVNQPLNNVCNLQVIACVITILNNKMPVLVRLGQVRLGQVRSWQKRITIMTF